ncbi:uncharacterized protein [Scyliorhinus torazame]|uniref:uncharacterized protein isoform X1 n=1 Tax=Scyliorhinus torazame TaxID=75743 RepID=UPI003B5CF9BF
MKEFLRITAPKIATAKKIVVLLTEEAAVSPFVYHQVLFSEWLGRPIATAMFRNMWKRFRPSLRVILASILWPFDSDEVQPKVFISYQWDVQSKVQKIRNYLEANGLPCWADLSVRGQSQMSTRSSFAFDLATETLQGQIQRNMKVAHAVVSCLTLRYIQSDNYIKDVQLAETLQKPLVPVLFQLLRWPPKGTSIKMRRFLFNFPVIDLSNDRLFHQNLDLILKRLNQYA